MTTTITTTPQKAKVYAIFDEPSVVFACRINQTFSGVDRITHFAFDGVTTGAYTDCKHGMTVLLGTSAGASDAGISYVRKALTSSMFYCGETSDVAFADNLYVTVLQDFGVWTETLTATDKQVEYMRYDLAYTDQHTHYLPVPVLGPDRVVRYNGSPVTVSFDGSGSWVFDSTIASHAFVCSGATISGGSTATPSLSFSAPGRYLVAYTVTSAAGASSTTYRTVHVWNPGSGPAVYDVILGTMTGSFNNGGWDYTITVASAAAANIHLRSKVILFSEEWYGNDLISYGPCVGAENIVAIGWVGTEKIVVDVNQGQVTFEAHGPHYWLQEEHDFIPVGLILVSGTPAAWLEMATLNTDRALWHYLMWRSTLSNCVDIHLTGDTRSCIQFTAQANSLWDQLKELSFNYIMALPCTDRYGRLFVQIDPVLVPAADRGSIPVTASITHDSCESIGVEQLSVPATSQILLSGVVSGGTYASPSETALFSLAPGHIPGRYGSPAVVDKLLLTNQAQANELAGNVLERVRLPYRFEFANLLYNNRMVDICPRQFVGATIVSTDSVRGISYTGNTVVKTIEMTVEQGAWKITWKDAQAETKAGLFTTGDTPVVTNLDGNGDFTVQTFIFPKMPPMPGFGGGITPIPPSPIPVTITPSACDDSSAVNTSLIWDKTNLTGAAGDNAARAWNPCVVRSGSYLDLSVVYKTGCTPTFHCYAIDRAGSYLVTGSISVTDYGYYGDRTQANLHITFAPASNTAAAGFEFDIEAGFINDAPLPMYQTNGHQLWGDLPEGSWDIFPSTDEPGVLADGTVTAYDAIRTVYDPTNGHAGYVYHLDGTRPHWALEIHGRFNWNTHDYGGEPGYLYMAVFWSSRTTNPAVPMVGISFNVDPSHGVSASGETWNSGLVKLANPYTSDGSWTQPPNISMGLSSVNSYASAAWVNEIIVDFYYAQATPVLAMVTLSPADLYNVCPAT